MIRFASLIAVAALANGCVYPCETLTDISGERVDSGAIAAVGGRYLVAWRHTDLVTYGIAATIVDGPAVEIPEATTVRIIGTATHFLVISNGPSPITIVDTDGVVTPANPLSFQRVRGAVSIEGGFLIATTRGDDISRVAVARVGYDGQLQMVNELFLEDIAPNAVGAISFQRVGTSPWLVVGSERGTSAYRVSETGDIALTPVVLADAPVTATLYSSGARALLWQASPGTTDISVVSLDETLARVGTSRALGAARELTPFPSAGYVAVFEDGHREWLDVDGAPVGTPSTSPELANSMYAATGEMGLRLEMREDLSEENSIYTSLEVRTVEIGNAIEGEPRLVAEDTLVSHFGAGTCSTGR